MWALHWKWKTISLKHQWKVKNSTWKIFSLSLTFDLGKSWSPSFTCGGCKTPLLAWMRREKRQLPFKIPRVWREPQNHTDDCFFCCVDISPYIAKKKKSLIVYPSMPSSIAPVLFESDDRYPLYNESSEVRY